jgi:general L-amino acid transport system permease protein
MNRALCFSLNWGDLVHAYTPGTHPDLPPPRDLAALWLWLRRNLFTSLAGTLVMLFFAWLLFELAVVVFDWAVLNAVWSADNGRACLVKPPGACWAFFRNNARAMMVFDYPSGEAWRVAVALAIGIAGLVWLTIDRAPGKAWATGFLVLVFPAVALVLVFGGFGLQTVEAERFGGLGYNLLIVLLSYPPALALGLRVAMGMESKLPVIRFLCKGFVGFWRAIPVILTGFAVAFAFPFFVPGGYFLPPVGAVVLALVLLFSAYAAEIIHHHLKAVPPDQFESALAFGFSRRKTMRLVVIPQALRMAAPGLVHTLIGVLKATTVITIGGFIGFHMVALDVATTAGWYGIETVIFAVTAVVFWGLCFGLSRYGRHLERRNRMITGEEDLPSPAPDRSLAASSLA